MSIVVPKPQGAPRRATRGTELQSSVVGTRRDLPAVHQVLEQPRLVILQQRLDHTYLVEEVRVCLDAARQSLQKNPTCAAPSPESVAEQVAERLERWLEPRLKAVINLTGTLLHTNLGRSPLSEAAIEAMCNAANSVNLEFDLAMGRRGDRDNLVEDLLCRLTGAEAASVVNNNAAAVYLVLNTLASRRRVAISRGELVEIGDSFRMPDIIRKSGCKLMEIGTTNRTHLKDYQQAIDEGAGLLLKVHTSNYRIEGFVHEVTLHELSRLGREAGVPVIADLGSGALIDLARWGLAGEPTVGDAVDAGIDLVTFSGDKLLGGPQAGIVVGRRELVRRIKRNPIRRALRCDKIRLAALEATLRAFLSPRTVNETLPAYRMIARPLSEIETMAAQVRAAIECWAEGRAKVAVTRGQSQVGSGSLPGDTLPTCLISLTPDGAAVEALAHELRALDPPVIGRMHGGKVLLDMRCLLDPESLLRALRAKGSASR
ncbi:L-seryl-tRNA(Sec) selenium transferase [Sulfuricaulis sp.]|uniref:L-seryl-tRNA(Sec) selenium transferase n=1 Tax=Sulfuricaulis sp. TaxID=2003553 RepID=UPI00355985E3